MKSQAPCILALLALAAWPVHRSVAAESGDDDQRPVTLKLGTGLEYDSNVAVLELDTSSGVGDLAAAFDFGVGYDAATSGRVDFKAGYNFSQSLHQDFDAFDVRIHRASLSLAYDLDRVDLGATAQYAHAELDGREFLVLEQVSPYLSKLVGKRLFLRFAYARSDKSFAGNPGRAATADAWSSDAYVFLNGLTTYLVFSYRADREDARDGQFDYSGDRLRMQLTRRFMAGSRRLTFKAGLRFEGRDYGNVTPTIGEPRRDDRYEFETSAELPLTRRVKTNIAYKRADNRSNLPSVDFAENVVSVGFDAEF